MRVVRWLISAALVLLALALAAYGIVLAGLGTPKQADYGAPAALGFALLGLVAAALVAPWRRKRE